MAQSLGSTGDGPAPLRPVSGPLHATKKKGCRQGKCSKWKGGKCRCGRE
ncbi:MAG: hypothetical protein VKI81_09900 [Synechococcaceae cyanobacterium]|nr:hypothetical protein [Synechococcaceae cyanobacterium]